MRVLASVGFLIDRLNTSASLYRIAPCLKGKVNRLLNVWIKLVY